MNNFFVEKNIVLLKARKVEIFTQKLKCKFKKIRSSHSKT